MSASVAPGGGAVWQGPWRMTNCSNPTPPPKKKKKPGCDRRAGTTQVVCLAFPFFLEFTTKKIPVTESALKSLIEMSSPVKFRLYVTDCT